MAHIMMGCNLQKQKVSMKKKHNEWTQLDVKCVNTFSYGTYDDNK